MLEKQEPFIPEEPEDALDQVLRAELRWESPPELTTRLCRLVQGSAPLLQSQAQAQTRFSALILLLMAVAGSLSLATVWQVSCASGLEPGLAAILQPAVATFKQGISAAYEQLPFVRALVEFLKLVAEQLHWIFIATVLWLALDGWAPKLPFLHPPQMS